MAKSVSYNLMIEADTLDKLRALSIETNLTVSEHIRRAVAHYLNEDPDKFDYALTKDEASVLRLLDFMRVKLPAEEKEGLILELKRSELMLIVGREWYYIKSIIDMTTKMISLYGIETLVEENILKIEDKDRSVSRSEKVGFNIMFINTITRNKLVEVTKQLLVDLRANILQKKLCEKEG